MFPEFVVPIVGRPAPRGTGRRNEDGGGMGEGGEQLGITELDSFHADTVLSFISQILTYSGLYQTLLGTRGSEINKINKTSFSEKLTI